MILLALAWSTLLSSAQPGLSHKAPAWIAVGDAPAHDYGVYYFRKEVQLQTVPMAFPVQVSGDNRYKLFVNGRLASVGPARSDLQNWNYEELDLKPYLQVGKNIIAALVWNDGVMKPEANMSYRSGFFMHGTTTESKLVDTDDSWLCIQDKGYQPLMPRVPGYYAAGPSELRDFRQAVNRWNSADCDLTAWQNADMINDFYPRHASGAWGTYSGWQMQRSPLPQPELTMERLAVVRGARGVKSPKSFLEGKGPLTIPAHTQAELLLDQQHLTNAYFTLLMSRGKGSRVSIGYAEGLYDKDMNKGDRNDVRGKHFVGRKDSLISSGGELQEFTTMSWRTYRYVVLRVSTADEPLTINDVYGTFTGYPFTLRASIATKNEELQKIFSTGWRTARLCAMETYMDCPYYEQLQYFGDARIQALVSLYNAGDDRLVKNYLLQADMSRTAEGITQSRYPSTLPQFIQPYALHCIYALHDYMMYGHDTLFVKKRLQGMRNTLSYFHEFQEADGRVKGLPGWNFSDWVNGCDNWENGVALPGANGCNAVMDMQLLYAYQMAAELEAHYGMNDYATLYHRRAALLAQTIKDKYFRNADGLFSDCSDMAVYSQHANALAILTHLVTGEQAMALAQRLEQDDALAPASIYFRFYLHQAMVEAGLGDHYLLWLDKWRENLQLGLTTWGETSEVESTRSDCHAWGASPNIEIFRTMLGIDSDAPCFQKVRIAPHLGNIRQMGGTMPHPNGIITVSYEMKKNGLHAVVVLPKKVTGTFVWQGKNVILHEGTNTLDLT